MKINICLIILILLSAFQFKKEDDKIPSDLNSSSIVIIIRNFNDWQHTIKGSPKGYDEYARNKMYGDYKAAITKMGNLFTQYNIKVKKQPYTDTISPILSDYVVDYKIECTGGEEEKDWWMCLGGFYFKQVSTGKEFEPFGTTNRIIKSLKRKVNSK